MDWGTGVKRRDLIEFCTMMSFQCRAGVPLVQGLKGVAEDCTNLRFRAVMMTSFAFILGVVPLLISQGAGAEMRFALGITVFSGMLGVTLFGIFFTPVFYSAIRRATDRRAKQAVRRVSEVPNG